MTIEKPEKKIKRSVVDFVSIRNPAHMISAELECGHRVMLSPLNFIGRGSMVECRDCGITGAKAVPEPSVLESFGVICPGCGSDEWLYVTQTVEEKLSKDGASDFDVPEIDDQNAIRCENCGRRGKVAEFRRGPEEVVIQFEQDPDFPGRAVSKSFPALKINGDAMHVYALRVTVSDAGEQIAFDDNFDSELDALIQINGDPFQTVEIDGLEGDWVIYSHPCGS